MSAAPPPPPGPGLGGRPGPGPMPAGPSPYGGGSNGSYGAPQQGGPSPYGAGGPYGGQAPMPPSGGGYLPADGGGSRGGATKWIILAVVGLLLLCCCGGIGAYFLTKDSDRTVSGTPEQTVRSFFQAMEDRDEAAACDLTDPTAMKAGDDCEATLGRTFDQMPSTFDADTVTVTRTDGGSDTSGTARCDATYGMGGTNSTARIDLRVVDGEWKMTDLDV